MLENKLNITNQADLANQEEKISKQKAKTLFESNQLDQLPIGTFQSLAEIHRILFEDIYYFAGKIRDVNIAKDNFKFAPRIFLMQSLEYIDNLPHSNFDQIVDKYSDMNIAHPFREGNGRAMRIWLDCMLKKALGQVVDWNQINKDAYFSAIIRSHVSTGELKYLLQQHLTQDLSAHTFMKGLDASYFYEGYSLYKTEDLQ